MNALVILNASKRTLLLKHEFNTCVFTIQEVVDAYKYRPNDGSSVFSATGIDPSLVLYTITKEDSNLTFIIASYRTSGEEYPLDVTTPIEFLEQLHGILCIYFPNLSARVLENNLDLVIILLSEMVDAGLVVTSHPNALEEIIPGPSLMRNILAGVGIQRLRVHSNRIYFYQSIYIYIYNKLENVFLIFK